MLLSTKLHPPATRPELLPRPDLLTRMRVSPDVKLTLVVAPAGWGKSTTLAAWEAATTASRPTAWLSLDEADNDPVRFWTYVVEALARVAPGVAATALALLRVPGPPIVDLVLPQLINALAALREPVVLVLDDYHVIRHPQIHEAMSFLLDHQPPTLHLAVASRSEPSLPVARLRARGQLTELRADDLRFREDEAASLLNGLLGLALGPSAVTRLHERTEGWVAGLHLAALSLRGRADSDELVAGFAGDHRHLADYLVTEVLANQPEAMRTFLLRTAVLERLSGPLCDAVTASAGSARLLAEIERANLFLVPLDPTGEWYRYHHLFGDLLRSELERAEPDLIETLHRRAAAWFRADGAIPEAFSHSMAAGDLAEAAEIIALHWNDYLNQGRLETVDSWLAALPSELVRSDPTLCLARAGTYLTMGRRDEVDPWLDEALRGPLPGPVRPDGTSVESEASIYRAVHRYMLGDIRAAAGAARRAVELERDGTSPWRAMASAALGRTLFWSGDLDAAAPALEDAVRHARPPRNNLSVIAALGYLAEIHVRRGDLHAADEHAARALRMSEGQGLAEHWVATIGLVARGKVLQRRGRCDQARSALERAAELARRGAGAVERAHAALALAQFHAAQGATAEAGRLLDEARAAVASCPDPGILTAMLSEAESAAPPEGMRPPGPIEPIPDALTEREVAVLRLLRSELSLREIGAALFVSHNTVKTHTRGIYRKIAVRNRAEAVARAEQLGLL